MPLRLRSVEFRRAHERLERVRWPRTARGDEPGELDDIDASFAGLDLRDPAVGDAEPLGESTLRQPRVVAEPSTIREAPRIPG